MLPYFLLLLFSVVIPFAIYRPSALISKNGHIVLAQKRNRMMLILFFLGFFVLLSLRDTTVGRDLYTYRIIFERCSVTEFKSLPEQQWELGYTIYNKIISMVSTNYRLFLIITALIILVPIYKLYSKEKEFSFLAIVLFINMPCFLMIFSGLRQAIAISIGILVYIAVEKKKYILSILLVLLAMSFHISAFVLVLIYPAFFLKIKAKHLLFVVPIMLVIYLFRIPLLSFIISLMPSQYIEFYGEIQQTGAIVMTILFLIFVVFAFVILDETSMSKKDYFMRNVLLVATIFHFFVPVHGLVQRASYYFLIFVPISILSVVKAPKKRLKNISDLAVVVMSIFFILYFFYNAAFSTDNLLDVFPYKFFWSGDGW